jgi:hypothetical protein
MLPPLQTEKLPILSHRFNHVLLFIIKENFELILICSQREPNELPNLIKTPNFITKSISSHQTIPRSLPAERDCNNILQTSTISGNATLKQKVTKFLCLNTITQKQRPVEKRFYALLTSQLHITDGFIAKKKSPQNSSN